MDELMVAQKRYISSKRASKETGYAQDYIGQLVRLRKVSATRVGKAWFVDEGELKRHLSGSQRTPRAESQNRTELGNQVLRKADIEYPSTWKPIVYSTDTASLMPDTISDDRDSNRNIANSALMRSLAHRSDRSELDMNQALQTDSLGDLVAPSDVSFTSRAKRVDRSGIEGLDQVQTSFSESPPGTLRGGARRVREVRSTAVDGFAFPASVRVPTARDKVPSVVSRSVRSTSRLSSSRVRSGKVRVLPLLAAVFVFLLVPLVV